MKFNCKHTVVAKCLKLGAEMMPKHFAGMIFVHLFLAVLPVFAFRSVAESISLPKSLYCQTIRY